LALEAAEAKAEAAVEAELRRGLPGLIALALLSCAAIAWRGFYMNDWLAVLVVGTMACFTGIGMWRGLLRGYFTHRHGEKILRAENPGLFWFCVFILGLMYAICVWVLFTGKAPPYF
jgi:hypothetical protein